MAAIFQTTVNPDRPIRLVNTQTLGAMCGTFRTHEEAEECLRQRGYTEEEFGRDGNTVWFLGGINC